MDTFVQTREKMKKEDEIKTENLGLSAFIRYRKLLVPKMGRIDIHQKYGISRVREPIDASLFSTSSISSSSPTLSDPLKDSLSDNSLDSLVESDDSSQSLFDLTLEEKLRSPDEKRKCCDLTSNGKVLFVYQL